MNKEPHLKKILRGEGLEEIATYGWDQFAEIISKLNYHTLATEFLGTALNHQSIRQTVTSHEIRSMELQAKDYAKGLAQKDSRIKPIWYN